MVRILPLSLLYRDIGNVKKRNAFVGFMHNRLFSKVALTKNLQQITQISFINLLFLKEHLQDYISTLCIIVYSYLAKI